MTPPSRPWLTASLESRPPAAGIAGSKKQANRRTQVANRQIFPRSGHPSKPSGNDRWMPRPGSRFLAVGVAAVGGDPSPRMAGALLTTIIYYIGRPTGNRPIGGPVGHQSRTTALCASSSRWRRPTMMLQTPAGRGPPAPPSAHLLAPPRLGLGGRMGAHWPLSAPGTGGSLVHGGFEVLARISSPLVSWHAVSRPISGPKGVLGPPWQ